MQILWFKPDIIVVDSDNILIYVLVMANRFPPIEVVPERQELVRNEDTHLNQHLAKGAEFVIDKTWDNKPITEHDPIRISMKWHFEKIKGRPHKRVIRVNVEAPLLDDPEPPNEGTGYCSNVSEDINNINSL